MAHPLGPERRGGFEIAALADGWRPDVVLLDLTLPDMPGVEAARRLNERASYPVLVLSARQPEVIREAARSIGASGVLRKPFDLHDLVAAVEHALRACGRGLT